MAFQIAIALAAGAWLGNWLDRSAQTPKPYFTALFTLLGLFAGLYLSLKDLIWGKNEKGK